MVPSDPDAVNARQLRTFLSKRLSSAMVPSAFMLLPELPLTPNGKVDRAALPAGTAVRPQAIVEAVPPLNDDDRRQLAAWNDTSVVHAGMRCLHQLVEAQVERTPDAIAVTSGGEGDRMRRSQCPRTSWRVSFAGAAPG